MSSALFTFLAYSQDMGKILKSHQKSANLLEVNSQQFYCKLAQNYTMSQYLTQMLNVSRFLLNLKKTHNY